MRGDVDIDVLLAGPLDEDDLGGGDDLAALEAQPHAGGTQDEGAGDHGSGLNTVTNIIHCIASNEENNIISENGNNIVGLMRLSAFIQSFESGPWISL